MQITVEQVVAAYRETGLKAVQGDYFPADGCACALGAIAVQNGLRKDDLEISDWYENNDFPFITPFTLGFDGLAPSNSGFWTKDDWQAYKNGRAAWKACMDAGLVVETV